MHLFERVVHGAEEVIVERNTTKLESMHIIRSVDVRT